MLNTYFISAELSSLPAVVNESRTLRLGLALRAAGAEYISVDGIYKGTRERSYMVRGVPLEAALSLGAAFGQESILAVDGSGAARLVYMDGRPDVSLGVARQAQPSDDASTRLAGVFSVAFG
jgi:hypothetical protein